MSLPRDVRPRSERSDTKTLVSLGRDDVSSSSGGIAPAAAATEPDGESGIRPVQLWFKGLAEPVRARAELGDGSLQLKADLPFLELDSVVGVATAADGARLHGHVCRVALAPPEDGRVPQLCVDISLTDSGIAPALGGGAMSVAPNGSVSSLAPRARKVAALMPGSEPVPNAAGGGRVLGWLAALAIGAACGAVVALAWLAPRLQLLERRGDGSAQAATEARTEPSERAPSSPVAPPDVPAEPATPVEAADVEASSPLVLAIADEDVEPPIPTVSPDRYDLLPPRLPSDDEGVLAVAESAWSAAVARAQAAAAATQLPQVSVHGAQTHVFVPMQGEGEGLQQYELTTPGIAVSVPHARALIPIDNYNIQRGIVRRVWLRREGEGVQVRVITRRTATRAAASFDETGLSIVLEP